MSQIFTYGTDISVDLHSLPESSIHALIRRGMSHYFGNEVSTKVSAWKVARAEGALGAPNDAEIAAAKADFTQAALEALLSGTVGQSIRGPRGSSVETEFNRLAEEQAKAILKSAGMVMPTKDKTVRFGDGTELSRSDIIARVKAKFGAELRSKAEKNVADRDRAAQHTSLEALGL
jgi:hypothetical protein